MSAPLAKGAGGFEPARYPQERPPGYPGPTRPSLGRGFIAYLVRHPIFCLFLLTPGIPEYLSSSSSITLLFVSPAVFFVVLGLNAGLYVPGALLIREAVVRWHNGWSTVILLGTAYALTGEGIALGTIFNPIHDSLGHYFGLNWVWTPAVIMVHVVFSIGLPILLLGLAVPSTRGRSLVGRRGIGIAFVVLAIDVVVLGYVTRSVVGFHLGWVAILATCAAIVALVLAAYVEPGHPLDPRVGLPKRTPRQLGALCAVVVVLSFLIPPIGTSAGAPFWVLDILFAPLYGLAFVVVVRGVGTEQNAPQLIGVAAGFLVPLAAIGFLFALPTPVVGVLDVALGVFLWSLWRRYGSVRTPEKIPVGGTVVTVPPHVLQSSLESRGATK